MKSVFSEPDGTGSMSRVLIGLLTTFIVGVGVSFAVSAHFKRVTVEEFNGFLSSAGQFLITTCGPLYAINKGADAYKNKQ